MIKNLSGMFHKTPPRMNDAPLHGMPLHQKQRELKLEIEASKADMIRTNPNGIRSKGKGDIQIKNNLAYNKMDDHVAYNRACIRYELANNGLNMFNKQNAKGLKLEAKTDAKLRAADGTGSLPSPRSASIAEAAPSGSMLGRTSPASWEAGDDAAAMGLGGSRPTSGEYINTPTLNASGSGSLAVEARAKAGSETPLEAPLDKYGMPKYYTTESGQKIPGSLFPMHESAPGTSRDMSDLTFSNTPASQQLDKYGMPKHYTTESGQQIPGYLFPGHESPGESRPISPSLTFEQPQNAASHGSLAPKPTPSTDPKAYLEQARQDLLGGNRREPDTGI
jgi:hypothetical protein